MKDVSGVVHIQGLVKDGTVGSANTIFTLPTGYRPDQLIQFAIDSNSVFGRAIIRDDGRVVPHTGNNASFTIDCSFYVG